MGVFLGFWVGFALLTGVEHYVHQLVWDKPVSWELAFRRSFKENFAYALLSLGALWLCGRLKPEVLGKLRWIGLHMIAAVFFAFAHLALVSWLEAGELSVQTGEVLTFSYLFEKLGATYTVSNMFKYWIVVLGHLGWQYYQRYRERERQAAALATELAQARLQALRMQINPHFLFNTLHTISCLVHSKPETADRMIARLSELLRATLDHGETHEVPLREEIDFLKRYLEIEQMRFADRLTVVFNVDAKAEGLMVPHLILQPLVENALRHGIEPREEPGRVEIEARLLDSGKLQLCVRNDGAGLVNGEGRASREGIGLRNVRSRLTHRYGAAQSFEIGNMAHGGVEARLVIPIVEKAQAVPTERGEGSTKGFAAGEMTAAAAKIL